MPVSPIAGRASAAGHEAVGYATLGQVVGGQLDQYFVAGQDADAVLAHLACGVAENLMAVLELHAEHRVGQQFHHLSAHLEEFFLGQIPFKSTKVAEPYSIRGGNGRSAGQMQSGSSTRSSAGFQRTVRFGSLERKTLPDIDFTLPVRTMSNRLASALSSSSRVAV